MLVVRAEPEERARAGGLAARIVAEALAEGRQLAPPPRAPADAAADPWLAEVLASVEERFLAFSLAECASLLDEAVARLDREGASSATRADMVELWLWRARVAEALDDAEGAGRAARQALAIDPALTVEPTRHPPSLAARVEAARPTAAPCPFPLAVAPEGALVALDGAPPAPAPASVGCGRHWVRVEAPAHLPERRAVLADPALPVEPLTLRFAPERALALPSSPGAPVPDAWRQAARALGRELVVLDVARSGRELVVALDGARVRAPLEATPDEVLALLRAARAPRGPQLDPALVAGVGVGAAAVVAVAISLAVVLGAPAPSGFTLRGELRP